MALHDCILPYHEPSAIISIAILRPNLVRGLVEQHVAIPVAMASLRVAVDYMYKKRARFRCLHSKEADLDVQSPLCQFKVIDSFLCFHFNKQVYSLE